MRFAKAVSLSNSVNEGCILRQHLKGSMNSVRYISSSSDGLPGFDLVCLRPPLLVSAPDHNFFLHPPRLYRESSPTVTCILGTENTYLSPLSLAPAERH